MSTETADIPIPIMAEPPAPPPSVAEPEPEPAVGTGLFDSIDWKNPVPGVLKVASHLQSLDKMTPEERLTVLRGALLHVIDSSSMDSDQKDEARLFVKVMVPHIIELAIIGLSAVAKVAAVEKKAEDILSHQPRINVRSIESVIADSIKRKWWRCFRM